MADNTQLATLNGVKALLDASRSAIATRLPKHVSVERITKAVLTAVNKNPKLLACTRESLLLSIMQAADLGLEPGELGEGYLIPYGNVCQFIPGYRGMISLARRSGQIVSIEAHVVHEGDAFDCCLGLDPRLDHVPDWDAASVGKTKLVYAIAKLKDGGSQFEVMSVAAINAIRARSKASNSGPWVTDYEEMARKTVIRRLFKYLPVSVEMVQALTLQAAAESGDFSGSSRSNEDADVVLESAPERGIKATIRAKMTPALASTPTANTNPDAEDCMQERSL